MDFQSEGILIEEQKKGRKNKNKGDLESHGKYGKFNNEEIDDRPMDEKSIHGRTSSSSTPPSQRQQ